VHLYDCFDPGQFLAAAYKNFSRQAESMKVSRWVGMLLFTETSADHWFQRLADGQPGDDLSSWTVRKLSEETTLLLSGSDGQRLYLVAGQQIVTAERLEVHVLGSLERIPDGKTIADTMQAAGNRRESICVLPWGVGKWLGKRGQIVRELIQYARPAEFFLGDISGRLRWAPAPSEFAAGDRSQLALLPGSDPLPLESELAKVGSYGFSILGEPDGDSPFSWLRFELRERPESIRPFGDREYLGRFVRNQIAMQLRKRHQ
jgi:hypothetical protein